MLIAIDGIDGSGKTTMCNLLKAKLESLGKKVYLRKRPSSGPIGVFLKKFTKGELSIKNPYSIALLFASDAYESYEIIKKKMEEGYIVISDRYYYSAFAYQSLYNMSWDWIGELYRFAPKPDIAFILDVDPEIALERIKNRKSKSIYEKRELLEEVRRNFRKLKEYLDEEIVIIDASLPIQEVFNQIWHRLRTYFTSL